MFPIPVMILPFHENSPSHLDLVSASRRIFCEHIIVYGNYQPINCTVNKFKYIIYTIPYKMIFLEGNIVVPPFIRIL